jgi:ferredoxin
MGMRVSVVGSECQGHGRCYANAEDLFEPIDDFGRAGVIGGDLVTDDPEVIDRLKRAVAGCPERAIELHVAEEETL